MSKLDKLAELRDEQRATYKIRATPDIAELISKWMRYKAQEKEAQTYVGDNGILKSHFKMLLPVGEDSKAIPATRIIGEYEIAGAINLVRVRQDRRAMDFDKLTELAIAKGAPPEAFRPVVRSEWITANAQTKDNPGGTITPAEITACFKGPIISYVTAQFVPEQTGDRT